ncbi:hypothetical protein [Xylanibacter muris]|uniref:Uncharacterized protein n=1 Tax=Xylanibacter muris TaxID=2736290 RepID=A0ABX2ANL9_9BACT|nr:hypothetical protein [Xylanibacter muris]NPD91814.1 hypothetical protein [Xylanibacter muris]
MRNLNIIKVLFVFCLLGTATGVSAQGFFKKLTKTVENASKEVDKATRKFDKALKSIDAATDTAAVKKPDAAALSATGDSVVSDSLKKKIKWEDIPVYTAKKVMVVDGSGKPVLNEDGTEQYHVFLFDQFGNKRSKEAVAAQQKKLNKAIGLIIAKVGGGALLGGLIGKGDVKSIATGAGAGLLLSAEDIEMAYKQKKSLKQQKKLLESYSVNFTDEGKPVDAKVDLSKIDGLDLNLDDGNAMTMTAADIKKEVESEAFNTTDDSAWDF